MPSMVARPAFRLAAEAMADTQQRAGPGLEFPSQAALLAQPSQGPAAALLTHICPDAASAATGAAPEPGSGCQWGPGNRGDCMLVGVEAMEGLGAALQQVMDSRQG